MSETASKAPPPAPTRRGALAFHPTALPARPDAGAGAGTGLRLSERLHTAKLILRGDPGDPGFLDAVAAVAGSRPPLAPNSVAEAGALALLWLGPDEWLLHGPDGDETALHAALTAGFSGRHAAPGHAAPGHAASGHAASCHASVVDVTDNSTLLLLEGPAVRFVLAKGCPLDLHPSAFAPGRCAQTLVGQVPVTLWQQTEDRFALLARRSFAPFLWDWLVDTGEEVGSGSQLPCL